MRKCIIMSAGCFACICILCPVFATTGTPSFERYAPILQRKPFGEVIPADPKPAAPEAASFAKDLEMRAIVDDGYETQVCFGDMQTKKTWYISLNETVDGLELVSVDYEQEEAIVRKDDETVLFSLKDEKKSSPEAAGASGDAKPVRKALKQHRPFFSKLKRENMPVVEQEGIPSPFKGQSIQEFLEAHPEAAGQYPSPIQSGESWEGGEGRGETINQFLREHPEAVQQFSPIQLPEETAPAQGKGKTIEEFLKEHADKFRHVEPPTTLPAEPMEVPVEQPQSGY